MLQKGLDFQSVPNEIAKEKDGAALNFIMLYFVCCMERRGKFQRCLFLFEMFLFVDVFMFENIYRVDCVTSF
jgi:hypothetical protein